MEHIREKYRHVFLESDMGLEVLEDILQECHFGSTLNPDNPTSVAEHNVGVVILNKCGVFADDTASQVIRALASVIPVTAMAPEQNAIKEKEDE